MPAVYDTYDYPSYWIGRNYEHQSEIIAIKSLLKNIAYVNCLLDIGAGFGRLTKAYSFKAKKIILSDPAKKLLTIAKSENPDKKFHILQSDLKNLAKKIKPKSIDLIILIRVLHHIKDLDDAFLSINKLLKKDGHLLLEFANKKHLKAIISEFFKGNFTFPLDIFPKDLRSRSIKKEQSLPFLNYHPDIIFEKLRSHGFEIIETRSVSNIRCSFIKKVISTNTLIFLEKYLQKPLAKICFGPSVFLLARKI